MPELSPTPREDCDNLLSEVLPFTERFLEKNREFYPVGAVMKTDGEIVWYGVQREEEFPKSKVVLADLLDAYRGEAVRGEIRAAIVLYDVKIRGPESERISDAICADCYHRADYAKRAFFPYHFSGAKLLFGEASGRDNENSVFA